jgi:hypothetical protein
MRQLIESADGMMVDLLFTPGSKPEPLQYERKAVVFYDVLGWRNQIQKAGNDPEKIAMLQRVILRPIQSLRAGEKTLNLKFSAFSDNITISCAAKQDSVFHLLVTLGSFVLGGTASGFLIRGGMTIGEVVHNEHAVFGPALNRAYELESRVASFPRIILDKEAFREFDEMPSVVAYEKDAAFIDPFTVSFVKFLQQMSAAIPKEGWERAGFNDKSGLHKYNSEKLLTGAFEGLKRIARSPLGDKEYRKVEWLYDRVASRLGVPLLKSYPRIYPKETT